MSEKMMDEETSASSNIDDGKRYRENQERAQRTLRNRTMLSIAFIMILGCAASAAFLAISITSAKSYQQDQFDRQATDLVKEIESSWNDYEVTGLWIHEACRHGDITKQEFRELYEYLRSGGLEFQAAEFIPNITNAERKEVEAASEAYYAEFYPDIDYQGIRGFEPVAPGSEELEIQPRSEQPFYFIVQHVEPVESNEAAIDLDLYSSSKRRASIDFALSSWSPALTDRLQLVQETDPSAYSVLLFHPGIKLSTGNKARDLSLMVIRIPSLLLRATKKQSRPIQLYLYDATHSNSESPPQFLGGVETGISKDEPEMTIEIELDELLDQETPVGIHQASIEIASSTWEVVVVPVEGTFQASLGLAIFGGVMIFVGALAVSVWMYSNMRKMIKIQNIQAQAHAESAIVQSLFPPNVRDRMLQEAGGRRYSVKKALCSDQNAKGDGISSEHIFGSKPIAEFFSIVTVMFADIVGFTAWSSQRDPSQVFSLLEVIYHSYDKLAKKRGVFKLETIGDCYVAVAGIPEARSDHAEVMTLFARDCMTKLHELTKSLEIKMGPDTGDLNLRVGLHSGPVTAGVLRGDKGRFQLFGDTMNTGSRMESTGQPGKIQVSSETATHLIDTGKEKWLTPRPDMVVAKGKGKLQTYWVDIIGRDDSTTSSSTSSPPSPPPSQGHIVTNGHTTNASRKIPLPGTSESKKLQRLIGWNVEIFKQLLKKLVARRKYSNNLVAAESQRVELGEIKKTSPGHTVLDEVVDVIALQTSCTSTTTDDHHQVEEEDLDPEVFIQIEKYITAIASLYRQNSFHNFEHCSHVLMSVAKLSSRIARSNDDHEQNPAVLAGQQDFTYGITSDPMTQFACAFSALIHDVDHPGVPNTTLVQEQSDMAVMYKNKSCAEQNSVDIAWNLLTKTEDYKMLLQYICPTQADLVHFRQLVVNMVMATDVMDKELAAQRKERWYKAFAVADNNNNSSSSSGREERKNDNEAPKQVADRKATIVLEHLIQASDVSHTMQHWHVYIKWNERLFHEMYKAWKEGHLARDPSETWYEGEKGFLDFYIIPLAKKLDTCGVFGVSSDELLNYAQANRNEWDQKGQAIVQGYLEKWRSSSTTSITRQDDEMMA